MSRVTPAPRRLLRALASSRLQRLEDALPTLSRAPDPALAARLVRTIAKGKRAARGRLVVTILLAFGVIATAAAAVLNAADAPTALEGDVATARAALARTAAAAGSATLVLLALRLAFDRYVGLVEMDAIVLAMRLAAK